MPDRRLSGARQCAFSIEGERRPGPMPHSMQCRRDRDPIRLVGESRWRFRFFWNSTVVEILATPPLKALYRIAATV